MHFQNRDGVILSAIYNHDGTLTRRHLKEIFWPEASLRALQKRLAKLVDNGYLARPTADHLKTKPIPEPVYWLGWQGILWIAGQNNLTVKPPTNLGENQMRKLTNQIRDTGLHWLREPRWNQLAHDLAVIDFQLRVERDVSKLPNFSLETWQHESAFRSDGDAITYQYADRDGHMKQGQRSIYPDSFFVITKQNHRNKKVTARARLLIELDNATHTNTRFGREKVAPGYAYIRSGAYKARFGDNSGRWLIVTTGETRMKHLMRQTRQMLASGVKTFLFTVKDKLKDDNVLIEPLWWQVGKEEPVALFPSE